jgi:hypothetical protein
VLTEQPEGEMNEISKDTFKTLDDSSKLNVLFDIVQHAPAHCEKQVADCSQRFDAIEKGVKKWGLAHIFLIPPFSMLGGFAAMWAKFKFGGN